MLRGKWILENIMGTPPPPPPPNVPALKDNTPRRQACFRCAQRMEEHRKNPACATCHKMMDPLGFALENFDAVGAVARPRTRRRPIDASGQLADGTKVNGPVALREALLKHPEDFVGT